MTLQHRLDALLRTGRREAERLYDERLKDSVSWVEDHLPRLRREAEHAEREAHRSAESAGRRGVKVARKGYDEHLRAPVTWIEDHLPRQRSNAGAILAPTLIAAAGAGVAFWWWTQWARGRAEAERAALDAAGGAAGEAHPEAVMAHAPPPSDGPSDTPDPSAGKLAEPAEEVMAHTPPSAGAGRASASTTADAGKLLSSAAATSLQGGVQAVLPPAAAESLNETLAVQAAKKPAARKAKPGPALN